MNKDKRESFKSLRLKHFDLLNEVDEAKDQPALLIPKIKEQIEEWRQAGEYISEAGERDYLRSILSFWGGFVFEHSEPKEYPETDLYPLDIKIAQKAKMERMLKRVVWPATAAVAVVLMLLAFARLVFRPVVMVGPTPAPTPLVIVVTVPGPPTATLIPPTATLVTPVPTPTQTPMPTATSTQTPTPTATSSPRPPTATPTNTLMPTPTQAIYPKPELISAEVRDQIVILEWQWQGQLGPDEHFDVRIYKGGVRDYEKGAWADEPRVELGLSSWPGGGYQWSVAVIRGRDGRWERDLSPESEVGTFNWAGLPKPARPAPPTPTRYIPTPKPTPTPLPYP